MTEKVPENEKAEILDNIEKQKAELSRVADLAQSVMVLQTKVHQEIVKLKRRIKASGGATQLDATEILGLVSDLFNYATITHDSSCVAMALFHREHQLFQVKIAAFTRLLVDEKKVFTREEVEKVLEDIKKEEGEKAEVIKEVKAEADFEASVGDLKKKVIVPGD